jgi:glycogen operon protein
MAGDAIDERGPRGERIIDDTLLLILNAADEGVEFRLPNGGRGAWELVLDTRRPDPPSERYGEPHDGGSSYPVAPRSVVVMRLPRDR